jgi:DNA-binding transcriptional ArsR family regulator
VAATEGMHQGKASRSVEEAVSYAVGHRIRIEILAALHDVPASTKDLAKIVGQPLSKVSHHVEELLASGSIEIARTETVGNVSQNFYSGKLPFYADDEDWAAMTTEERQLTSGVIIQASMAEALASLWAGKLNDDLRVMLAWKPVNLDEQGRQDLADEQARSWARIEHIEAESASRRVESGGPPWAYLVASFGFQRSRTSAPPPSNSDEN